MSKKIAILSGIVIVIALLLYVYNNQIAGFYEISGRIEKIEGSSIIVFGAIKSSDSRDLRRAERRVKFNISSQTELKSKTIVITSEQIKSGQQFTPGFHEQPGSVSNLAVGVSVRIKSKDNLFEKDEATASLVNYISYDLPSITE